MIESVLNWKWHYRSLSVSSPSNVNFFPCGLIVLNFVQNYLTDIDFVVVTNFDGK